MATKHRFLETCYCNGAVEFEAGTDYEPNDRSAFYVATGRAVAVDVADEPAADAAAPAKKRRGLFGTDAAK